MLVAFDKRGQLVNTILSDVSKKQGPFSCPSCRSVVHLKSGKIMRPHFAHQRLGDCHFLEENESAEHLNLKGELYRWARQATNGSVELEKQLPELGQIADLMIDEQLALEVQCSSLSAERLRQRTFSYREAGYQVLWLLGRKLWLKDRLTDLQKDFLYFSLNRGFHFWELDDAERVIRLNYLIHEDLHGRVQYLTETFAFGEGDLLDCLRKPFAKQALSHFQGKMDEAIERYVAKQLRFCNPKWMAKQALAYQRGENLLTQTKDAFYPQIRPVAFTHFAQIQNDLVPYYQRFLAYYAKIDDKSTQILYSPAFYDKIYAMEDFKNGQEQNRY